jgi:hypothetical protein
MPGIHRHHGKYHVQIRKKVKNPGSPTIQNIKEIKGSYWIPDLRYAQSGMTTHQGLPDVQRKTINEIL